MLSYVSLYLSFSLLPSQTLGYMSKSDSDMCPSNIGYDIPTIPSCLLLCKFNSANLQLYYKILFASLIHVLLVMKQFYCTIRCL